MKKTLPALLLGLGLLAGGVAPAGAQGVGCYSDAQIRAAVQSGQVIALSNLLGLITARSGGQVVSSRLCVVNGRPMYVVNVLAGGQVSEVHIDATTGTIL